MIFQFDVFQEYQNALFLLVCDYARQQTISIIVENITRTSYIYH